jgi:hypothetical protein
VADTLKEMPLMPAVLVLSVPRTEAWSLCRYSIDWEHMDSCRARQCLKTDHLMLLCLTRGPQLTGYIGISVLSVVIQKRCVKPIVLRLSNRSITDSSQITIWGGSAGGGSVTAQLILNGGEDDPPFRAAIPEYPWWQSYKSQDILDGQYTDLLAASNCSDLPCLRGLSFEELSNATTDTYQIGYQAGKYAYGDFYYGPTVDGVVIRDYPQREIEAGHFSKVALLIDHSAFEGKHATSIRETGPC